MSDAEQLIEVTASLASLGLKVASCTFGADVSAAPVLRSSNWLSRTDRNERDAIGALSYHEVRVALAIVSCRSHFFW